MSPVWSRQFGGVVTRQTQISPPPAVCREPTARLDTSPLFPHDNSYLPSPRLPAPPRPLVRFRHAHPPPPVGRPDRCCRFASRAGGRLGYLSGEDRIDRAA